MRPVEWPGRQKALLHGGRDEALGVPRDKGGGTRVPWASQHNTSTKAFSWFYEGPVFLITKQFTLLPSELEVELGAVAFSQHDLGCCTLG